VASLVAAVSFTLFPLGLLGGLVAAVLGRLALDSCIAQAGNRSAIVSCITHLASRIWP
jgi:hypothetical protein